MQSESQGGLAYAQSRWLTVSLAHIAHRPGPIGEPPEAWYPSACMQRERWGLGQTTMAAVERSVTQQAAQQNGAGATHAHTAAALCGVCCIAVGAGSERTRPLCNLRAGG